MILLITLVTLIISACVGSGIYPRNKSVPSQSQIFKKASAPKHKEVLEQIEYVD